jgi:hypothetical protein
MSSRHIEVVAITYHILSYTLVLAGHVPSGKGARVITGDQMRDSITMRATHHTRRTVSPRLGRYVSILLVFYLYLYCLRSR